MLFNSDVFIFMFLPCALVGFILAAKWGRTPAIFCLIISSLIFYSWWSPRFLPILIVSMAFNYTASLIISRLKDRERLQSIALAVTVATDLIALAYYKYLSAIIGFFAPTAVSGHLSHISLPLGISFFTFTQIGYLIDIKQGVAKDRGPLSFALFVTFFPHLIAGPILHNREMIPQYADPKTFKFSKLNFLIGLCIFSIGLVKKCVFADPISAVVSPGYAHVTSLSTISAWNVALSYSLQLYFDFSGYSDMAIGLARMFNIRFPLNFNSPYKASNIIDYWQRWHMTLTRYLTLYLYNPIALTISRNRLARGLGVNRKAQGSVSGFTAMVAVPTLVTMTLAGVWHGAGLQFVIFGLLHGFYLCINHGMRLLLPKPPAPTKADSWPLHAAKVLLTYLAVLVASIFFRAPSVSAALQLLAGMIGAHGGMVLGTSAVGVGSNTELAKRACWLAALYVIIWAFPNTQQILIAYEPALGRIEKGPMPWLRWKLTPPWTFALGVTVAIGIYSITTNSEFLYFRF